MTEMSQAWWQKPKTSALETETGGPAWPIQLTTILNYRVRPSLKRKKKCRYEKAKEKQNSPSYLLLTPPQSSGEEQKSEPGVRDFSKLKSKI